MSDVDQLIAEDGLEELDERVNYDRLAFVELAEAHGATYTVERVDKRPDGLGGWGTYHYRYTFTNGSGVKLSGYFSCGSGIKEEPDAADILNAVRDDVREYHWVANKTYKSELGRYAAWQRQISREGSGLDDSVETYESIQVAYDGLIALFGNDGFEQLLELEGL